MIISLRGTTFYKLFGDAGTPGPDVGLYRSFDSTTGITYCFPTLGAKMPELETALWELDSRASVLVDFPAHWRSYDNWNVIARRARREDKSLAFVTVTDDDAFLSKKPEMLKAHGKLAAAGHECYLVDRRDAVTVLKRLVEPQRLIDHRTAAWAKDCRLATNPASRGGKLKQYTLLDCPELAWTLAGRLDARELRVLSHDALECSFFSGYHKNGPEQAPCYLSFSHSPMRMPSPVKPYENLFWVVPSSETQQARMQYAHSLLVPGGTAVIAIRHAFPPNRHFPRVSQLDVLPDGRRILECTRD